ncbi:MAG TPA: hypothetical protein VFU47_08930, partial [Armatimonadota bacterium]|nr:hypothetical protein [Armatimonadota bacterium]
MGFLKHNLPWKLLSLALAVIVAFYVRKQEDVLQRPILLPISLPVSPGQRVIEPRPGGTIQVTLEGPTEKVRAINVEDLKLTADMSRVQPGKRTAVPITVELAEKYRGDVSISWRPRSVDVLIRSDATQEFPVSVKPLESPEGWQLAAPLKATPERANVSGPQEQVSEVVSVVAPFRLKPEARIGEQVTLQAVDRDGNNVSRDVRIEPAQVLVTGTQERIVLQKRVPVQPIFSAPSGQRVQVEVNPPFVRAL